MSNKVSYLASKRRRDPEEVHWLSVSDLMAGLMMVFLFISVALIRDVSIVNKSIEDIVKTYIKTQDEISKALNDEFKDDLKTWGAEINPKTLSFIFKSPDVLFDSGNVSIKPKFKEILANFFPRYLKILKKVDPDFYDNVINKSVIQEIRIEGHTSSEWNGKRLGDEAYFNNMSLSQGRTRSVLEYIHSLDVAEQDKQWIKRHIAAVGYSSSKLTLDTFGKEDENKSRRVEFRVITNAEQKIAEIIEKLK